VTSDGAGAGSVFTVRLPLRSAPADADRPRVSPARVAVKRRILVVEDNTDARDMLRLLLTMSGHDVDERADGHLQGGGGTAGHRAD
jgi:hypothetical protein